MTVKEIIDRVQHMYSKGVASDDTRLESRLIYNKLNTVRLSLLSELLSKYSVDSLDDGFYSEFMCQMIEQQEEECNGIMINNCNLKKTDCDVDIVMFDGKPLIKAVFSADNSVPISFIKGNLIFDKKWMFSQKMMYYTYYNKRIYIANSRKLKYINLKAVLEDPIETLSSRCVTGDRCVDIFSFEFPLPDRYIDSVIERTVQSLVHFMLSVADDKLQNTQDERYINQSDKTKT